MTAACKCGWSQKGFNGPSAPPPARPATRAAAPSTTPAASRAENFKAHAQRCSQGKAPLPDDN